MSRPLPRWARLWLPLGFLVVAVAAGIAVLTGGEPEPVGPDTAPIPAETSGRDGPLSFQVGSTECGFENVIAAERIPAEGQFCLVEVSLGAAVAPEPTPLDLSCQYLVTDAQERFLVHEEATLAGVDPLPFRTGIRPGGRRDLELTFDIPSDARAVGVELHATCDSQGVRLDAGPSEPALDSG
jgi:hypothetical protein